MKDLPLRVRATALFLVLLLAAPGLLQGAVEPQLPNPGTVAGVTRQQQEQVGLQAMGEIYKQMPILPDSNPVSQYVQQLGKKLVATIPAQYSWPFQFHVVEQKEINAFALPGGPVFVNLGTIEAASNESELAGVMAHEIAHVYMQHSMKAAKKRSVPGTVAGVLGGLLGAYGGALGDLASMGIQIGAGAVFTKYSRADEAQADAVGAVIMYQAGFNPQALVDFFKKLEQSGGSEGPQFLSDHPNPGDRQAAIRNEIKDWPEKQWLQDSPQFEQAKDSVEGIKAYTAQEIADGAKQGVWAKRNAQQGAMPAALSTGNKADSNAASTGAMSAISIQQITSSSRFALLEHQDYRISYPDNWKVYGDQQSPTVTIAPRGGVSQKAVAYGAIINGYRPQSNNASVDQATKELLGVLKQQNPGLREVGDPQGVTVNGVHGDSVDLMGSSPVQQNGQALSERSWLVSLPKADGSLLYVVFVSPEPSFDQLRPTFERMLRTLHLQ